MVVVVVVVGGGGGGGVEKNGRYYKIFLQTTVNIHFENPIF